MTSFPDLEKTLPSLQGRFAITVVYLTEYRGLGTMVQKDLEKGQEAAVVIPMCPMQSECNHQLGVGKDCFRLQTARDRVYLIGQAVGANSD